MCSKASSTQQSTIARRTKKEKEVSIIIEYLEISDHSKSVCCAQLVLCYYMLYAGPGDSCPTSTGKQTMASMRSVIGSYGSTHPCRPASGRFGFASRFRKFRHLTLGRLQSPLEFHIPSSKLRDTTPFFSKGQYSSLGNIDQKNEDGNRVFCGGAIIFGSSGSFRASFSKFQ